MCRLNTGNICIKVFKAEQQLIRIEALRPSSELAALQGFHDGAQSINLGLCFDPFALARHNQDADHLLQRLNVVWQGGKIDVHVAKFKPSPR